MSEVPEYLICNPLHATSMYLPKFPKGFVIEDGTILRVYAINSTKEQNRSISIDHYYYTYRYPLS